MSLLHIYTTGRFGPENQLGFVIASDGNCIKQTSYIAFDKVASTSIPESFFRNPLSITNLHEFLNWNRNQNLKGGLK